MKIIYSVLFHTGKFRRFFNTFYNFIPIFDMILEIFYFGVENIGKAMFPHEFVGEDS